MCFAKCNSVANRGASDVASHGDNHAAFNVANFVALDVASRDYHLVANPVLTVLPTGKNCFYGGVTGLSGRRPNLCGCVWLAVVAWLAY
jgi:hypothetical protein